MLTMKYKIAILRPTNTNTQWTQIQLYNTTEHYMTAKAPICTTYRHKIRKIT